VCVSLSQARLPRQPQGTGLEAELESEATLQHGGIAQDPIDARQEAIEDKQLAPACKPLYASSRAAFPHWEVMVNSSQYSGDSTAQPQPGDDWILSAPAANYALLWENPMLPYRNAYGAEIYGGSVIAPPPWWTAEVNRRRIAHIVHTVNQNEVGDMITLSRERGTPSIYGFDGTAGSYERVPCFFEQEVAAIQDHVPVAATTWCENPSPGACTDINTDSNNCGGCDRAGQPHHCAAGTSCSNGTCASSCGTCPAGTRCSNGTCVSSCGPSNCGGCCDSGGMCHTQSNDSCGIRGSACNDCTAQGEICLETDTCTGQWACMDPTCRSQAAPACRAFCP
jgi:hypothetical protein